MSPPCAVFHTIVWPTASMYRMIAQPNGEPRTENGERRTKHREPTRAENREPRTKNQEPRTNENREQRTENKEPRTENKGRTAVPLAYRNRSGRPLRFGEGEVAAATGVRACSFPSPAEA